MVPVLLGGRALPPTCEEPLPTSSCRRKTTKPQFLVMQYLEVRTGATARSAICIAKKMGGICLKYLSPGTCHLSPITCHFSLVTCHLSPVTCHLSPVTCHLSLVTCHLSPVICHLQPRPQTLPKPRKQERA